MGAWTLEGLKDCCDVTLLTWDEVDYSGTNRAFGTSLKPNDFRVRTIPRWQRSLVRNLPIPAEQLRLSLLMAEAQRTLKRNPFDAVIGTDNEADFGRRGIQYVHYPWRRPPLENELRPIHRVPGLLPAYRLLSGPALGVSTRRIRQNRTLVNSGFVANRYRQYYRADAEVVHPPVPGGFPNIPWAERTPGFVCVGRYHPVKRWHWAVRIVERLRTQGFPATLAMIGLANIRETLWELQALAANRPWLSLHVDVPRDEMVRIVSRHRYGLHPMEEEHFGIAVAELVRAGCMPFVHNSGGPPEIVGGRAELTFDTVEEGVDKAARVLSSSSLEQTLRRHLETRRDEFSETAFVERIRAVVGESAKVPLGRMT